VTDELQGFEDLIGSNFDDTLTGDSSVTRLLVGAGSDWLLIGNGAAGVIFTHGWETIGCFAEVTRIVTPYGEDAVEIFRAGDMVLAMRDGQAGFEPLRWVSFMDIAVPRNGVMAAKTAPNLIKAGAMAPGMPARTLLPP